MLFDKIEAQLSETERNAIEDGADAIIEALGNRYCPADYRMLRRKVRQAVTSVYLADEDEVIVVKSTYTVDDDDIILD